MIENDDDLIEKYKKLKSKNDILGMAMLEYPTETYIKEGDKDD